MKIGISSTCCSPQVDFDNLNKIRKGNYFSRQSAFFCTKNQNFENLNDVPLDNLEIDFGFKFDPMG